MPMGKSAHTKLLIEFESLYDIAWGVIKYIKDKANSIEVFDQNVIQADRLTLMNILHERREYNPLLVAATSKYANEIDMLNNIYLELLSKRYEEVLKRSPKTDIFGLLNMYRKLDGFVQINIMCNKSIEEQFIKELDDDCNIIYTGFSTNVNDYDVLIVDDYTHVIRYHLNNIIRGKEIICFDSKYNMEPNGRPGEPLRIVTAPISDVNRIKTICPYAKFKPAEG